MGLSVFSLVAANVLFLWGLGIYMRVREGWAMVWAVWSAGTLLVPGGWLAMRPEAQAWSGAGPGLLAVTAWVMAAVYFRRSLEQPNHRGIGVIFLLQGLLAAGITAAILLLDWPLRF